MPQTEAPASAPSYYSEENYAEVDLPLWASHLSISWDDIIIGDQVIGTGHFGDVRDGAVKQRGNIIRARIRTLGGNF